MSDRLVNRHVMSHALFLIPVLAVCSCSKDGPAQPEITVQRQLQNALDSAFNEHDGKGISAAVIIPGAEIWLGTQHVEGSVPIDPDDLFWVASVTKMFTAAATLQLIDEGMLDFDDQLHEFLPTYTHVDSTITIRQLLNHTSGVADFPNHPQYDEMIDEDPNRIWTPEEIVTRLFFEPYFGPGEGWWYSSGGYTLLGMIISEVTGRRVSEVFRERIYEPIGLQNTFLDCEETITGDFAAGWADVDDDGILDEVPVLSVERYAETSTAYTSGGLFSTAEDVARFTHALFGAKVVISQEMLDQMLDFNMDMPAGFGWLGYGMGAEVFRLSMVNGAHAYGHGGWGAVFVSATAYLPDYDATITILVNAENWVLWEGAMNALCRVIMEYIG